MRRRDIASPRALRNRLTRMHAAIHPAALAGNSLDTPHLELYFRLAVWTEYTYLLAGYFQFTFLSFLI